MFVSSYKQKNSFIQENRISKNIFNHEYVPEHDNHGRPIVLSVIIQAQRSRPVQNIDAHRYN